MVIELAVRTLLRARSAIKVVHTARASGIMMTDMIHVFCDQATHSFVELADIIGQTLGHG